MRFQSTPLSEVCEVIMGQAPVGASYNENGEGLPLIAGAGDFGSVTPSPKKHTTAASKISQVGDLILCIRATIGDLNWGDKEYCLGRGVAGLRPKKSVLNKDYLWHFIQANKHQLSVKGTGSTFKQVSRSHIAEWEIPLPPLSEQKRIATILDKADAIRRKRQQAIQLADEFLRAVFLDMFGDPVTNPKGRVVRPVGEICGCIVPGRDKPKSFTGSTPWITTNELNHLGITTKKEKFIGLSEEEIAEVKAKVVPAGSVLMTCVGDLGVVSIAGDDMVINQQLHAFLLSDFVTPSFLSYALAWQKEYMLRMSSSTTVPYMNKTVCNSVPVVLPPTSLQERFEKIVEKVTESKAVMSVDSGANLFESISQRSFSGEL